MRRLVIGALIALAGCSSPAPEPEPEVRVEVQVRYVVPTACTQLIMFLHAAAHQGPAWFEARLDTRDDLFGQCMGG